jgi:cytochrome c
MMGKWLAVVCSVVVLGAGGAAALAADASHGRLLYENQCAACHSSQAHWRDARVVRTWDDLVAQVKRWQANAGASWSGEDIQDVAAYLNDTYYKLPCPSDGCGGMKQARGRPL